jgi:hypothetical protein
MLMQATAAGLDCARLNLRHSSDFKQHLLTAAHGI